MNRLTGFLFVSGAYALFATAAYAADSMGSMPGMGSSQTAPAAQTTHSGTGTVKAVDAAQGKVTIAHEAIKSLQWPAMTMGFTVRDKALLGKLAAGKKVDFKLVQQGNAYVIIDVK